MLKKKLTVGVVVLFLSISVIPNVIGNNSSFGKTIYVDDDGGADYTRIQDAVDNASDGDTIYVYSGIYNEEINITKQLFLLGIEEEGQSKPLIKGPLFSNTLNIYSNGCLFENFQVECTPTGRAVRNIRLLGNNTIIKNCRTRNGNTGIYIKDSSNNTIKDCEMTNTKGVVLIGSSDDNLLINNYIHDNSEHGVATNGGFNNKWYNNTIKSCGTGNGFYLVRAKNWIFKNNYIASNHVKGIELLYSINITLIDNVFFDNGISIKDENVSHWDTHTFIGNLINGKAFYLFSNIQNISVPTDAGQVILVNCSNCVVKNLEIEHSDYGIFLKNSDNNYIIENTIKSNDFNWNCGIHLSKSMNNFVLNNTVYDFSRGISLSSSCENIIANNSIHNCNYGIRTSNSSYNYINYNVLIKCEDGISMTESFSNKIQKNTVTNSNMGIKLVYTSDNEISNNYLAKSFYGMLVDSSLNTLVEKNTFTLNDIGLPITESQNTQISNNNFILNTIDALPWNSGSRWFHNYWGKPRVAPKMHLGVRLFIFFVDGEPSLIILPLIEFDFFPRKVPYTGDNIVCRPHN